MTTDAKSKTGETASSAPAGGRGLLSTGYLGLLLTQFLTATNDNLLRWLVIGISKQQVAEGQIGLVLAAGTACFVIPYLLLAAPAGFFADRFSKRTVIVICKAAEIGIMLAAVGTIAAGNVWLLLVIVLLMGAQSALFSPSRLGIIPEMLRADRISAANGWLGLATVSAVVVGAAAGNLLSDDFARQGQAGLGRITMVVLGIAVVGLACSLLVTRMPAANPLRKFPWNAAKQTWLDLQTLAAGGALMRVALGIAFFWSLGVLANLNIDQFAAEGGATEQAQMVPLLLSLVMGIGVGSVLAGIWSAGRVELGIVPLGAAGIALGGFLLFTVRGTLIDPEAAYTVNYYLAAIFLFVMGASAGLFDVPLSAYMQHRSAPESRGRILAASNFLTFAGMLVMSITYGVLRAPVREGRPMLSASEIFLLSGLLTLPVLIYIVWLIPQATIRFVVWLVSKWVYRIRLHGLENVPPRGGALLVADQVSWLDGAVLLVTSSRTMRLLARQSQFDRWPLNLLARLWGVIPVSSAEGGAYRALDRARKAIQKDELVVVFDTGMFEPTRGLKPSLARIVRDTMAPIVPVELEVPWVKGKRRPPIPRRFTARQQINIRFHPPIAATQNQSETQNATEEIETRSVSEEQTSPSDVGDEHHPTADPPGQDRPPQQETGDDISPDTQLDGPDEK